MTAKPTIFIRIENLWLKVIKNTEIFMNISYFLLSDTLAYIHDEIKDL